MAKKQDKKESKAVGLTQESTTAEPVESEQEEEKKVEKIELEQVRDDRFTVEDDALVDNKEPASKGEDIPEEVSYTNVINGHLSDLEQMVAYEPFKTGNPQSHRTMGAVLNMLKSARDHLGDR